MEALDCVTEEFNWPIMSRSLTGLNRQIAMQCTLLSVLPSDAHGNPLIEVAISVTQKPIVMAMGERLAQAVGANIHFEFRE